VFLVDASLHLDKGSTSRFVLPFWLRAFVRARESGLVLAAVFIGVGTGLLVACIGLAAQRVHELLYGIAWNSHLSLQTDIAWWRVMMSAPLGALVLAGVVMWAGRRFDGRMADAIEANALRGGHMSFAGSVFITVQTFISNACGASVGLEAAYTQICASFASLTGRGLAARRNDMRLLVGCGAAGAIAAAFDAPLAGAFYAFEIILGDYNVASLVPVVASAVVASAISGALIDHALLPVPDFAPHISALSVVLIFVLAGLCAGSSIMLMQGVAFVERVFEASRIHSHWRALPGGICVGAMALITPQIMGSGHGALQFNIAHAQPILILLMIFSLKSVASMLTLGAGFRGGLFFASLLLGSLLGRLFAQTIDLLMPQSIDVVTAALAGMAALGTGVIGAPITMTVLALEITGDFQVTVAALIACSITSLIVRELFGYSFATWRFHLRGETIRGPHDIGWLRELRVERIMRMDIRTLNQNETIASAQTIYPIGSEKQIFLIDDAGHYSGIVLAGDLYAAADDRLPVASLAVAGKPYVLPTMTLREALDVFERYEADVLPVVDDKDNLRLVGMVTEAHALRRYGAELERRTKDNIAH
jgi:chloride channel protein, CIC family